MNNKTGFIAFETIVTYAVDKPIATTGQKSVRELIGLDENSFFEKLYVHRNVVDEIKDYLLLSPQTVLVHGFPGTGKTTVVYKAIREMKKERKLCVFTFDFKGNDNQLKENDIENIGVWHEVILKKKLQNYLLREKITNDELIKFFFQEEHEHHILDNQFEKKRMEIFNEYSRTIPEKVFGEWFEENLVEGNPFILERFNALIEELTTRDYLYFIANQTESLCILFYDNLDSIISNETRDLIYKFIRKYCGTVSPYTRIILTSRTSSIVKDDMPDYGSYYWHKIPVDYKEFISDSAFQEKIEELKSKKGTIHNYDYKKVLEKLEKSSKEEFAKAIIEKRTSFLEDAILNGKMQIDDFSESLDEIKAIYTIILESKHIHNALLELSNHNRQFMFKLICDFIHYLIYEINVETNTLGETLEERSYSLESFFYHWTIDNAKLHLSAGVDLVKDIEEWNKSTNFLGCSFSFLIIAAIYNLTNKERGAHSYTTTTTIDNLKNLIKELGYSEIDIQKKVFSMFRQGDTFIGMIETSKYFGIENPNDLADSIKLWLTPRAAFMAEYLSYKFLFMIALLRHNRVNGFNNKVFDYDDRCAISLNTIGINLLFLCNMAFMHCIGLQKVRDFLFPVYGNSWYSYYKHRFCIMAHAKDDKEGLGDLQLNNILRSHRLFLQRQSNYEGYTFINNEVKNQYRKLERAFKEIEVNIVDGIRIDIDKDYFTNMIDFEIFNSTVEKKSNFS